MKKIIIRCDSSLNIGTGHVIRCLTIAEWLRSRNHQVTFISRDLMGNIISIIEEKQFKVVQLPQPESQNRGGDDYDIWRGVPIEVELAEIRKILDAENPHHIIVDHYGLSKNWEEVAGEFAPVMAIDDINRTHSCDALLDQNFSSESLFNQYLLNSKINKCFFGPQYALLNNAFTSIKAPRRNFETMKNVLIFFGGIDGSGETLKLLSSSSSKLSESSNYDVVVGKSNPDLLKIKKLSDELNIKLHIQTNKMHELMCRADLFLGASGSTTWERCYLGLPSICVAVAENQINIAQSLHNMNFLEYLGLANNLTGVDYHRAIDKALKDPSRLQVYSDNSLSLNVSSRVEEIINYLAT